MGIASILATFTTSIIFNVIMPTGDTGSDLSLMINTITFNLGDSLELEACKSCYNRRESEVYDSKLNSNSSCAWVLEDQNSACGQYPFILKKLNELENTNYCAKHEHWTINATHRQFSNSSECISSDECCLKINYVNDISNDEIQNKKVQHFPNVDPRVLVYCSHDTMISNFQLCIMAGKASLFDCISLGKLDFTLLNQIKELEKTEISKIGKKAFVQKRFKLQKINDRNVKISNGFNYEDGCGLFFSDFVTNQDRNTISYNENSCLTHLKYLHRGSSIIDFSDWRQTRGFTEGKKVGGTICKLLQLYGISILIPILLNFSFNVVVFIRDLKHKKANRYEVIPLILLVYPQWRVLKFLCNYVYHRNEDTLNKDKDENERDVASLEAFLEACLQVHFHFTHFFQDNQ